MYTGLDKAIVAFVMSVIGILGTVFHTTIGVSAETVASVVAILTPILVYVWPNAPKDDPTATAPVVPKP